MNTLTEVETLARQIQKLTKENWDLMEKEQEKSQEVERLNKANSRLKERLAKEKRFTKQIDLAHNEEVKKLHEILTKLHERDAQAIRDYGEAIRSIVYMTGELETARLDLATTRDALREAKQELKEARMGRAIAKKKLLRVRSPLTRSAPRRPAPTLPRTPPVPASPPCQVAMEESPIPGDYYHYTEEELKEIFEIDNLE